MSWREWWHKIRGLESFRMKYPEGKTSVKMDYKTCLAYQAIFNGEIIFDTDYIDTGFSIL